MAKPAKFMVTHHDPNISWEKIEENWAKAASVESATWIRTYYNRYEGVRYCLWMAQDSNSLKEIFKNLNVSWESVIEVEETVPDLWGKDWEKHVVAEAKADTLAF
jgi:hypothetical protein